jgi:hypothetical protein
MMGALKNSSYDAIFRFIEHLACQYNASHPPGLPVAVPYYAEAVTPETYVTELSFEERRFAGFDTPTVTNTAIKATALDKESILTPYQAF